MNRYFNLFYINRVELIQQIQLCAIVNKTHFILQFVHFLTFHSKYETK